jgi:anti-sigma regulatory factor (Ser/Thr protein kinase)
MEVGYSTASQSVRDMGFGAGMGLPNIKNNTDRLSITSKVGEGTTVEIYNHLH